MRIKTAPVRIKAAGTQDGTDEGVFEAIVAAYNTDSVGDRIVPGAFAATLAEWKGRGDPIPVLWSHMAHDPDYHIGVVEEAEERPGEGLWVRGRIDLDEAKAAKVYRLMKGRRVTQFSFAYEIVEGSPVDSADDEAWYELRKIKLYEVGPTLIGSNQNTQLLATKTLSEDRVKEIARGAVEDALAAHTTSALTSEQLQTLARIADEATDDGQSATPPAPPAADETQPGKSDPPARRGPASIRLHTDLALLMAEV